MAITRARRCSPLEPVQRRFFAGCFREAASEGELRAAPLIISISNRDVAGLFLMLQFGPNLEKSFLLVSTYRHPPGFGWLGLASRCMLAPLQVPSDRHGEATHEVKNEVDPT